MTGWRFGKWIVLGRFTERRGTWWNVRCDCGKASVVSSSNLRGGFSRSCGCVNVTQGWLSTTREYGIWAKMIRRCHCPANTNYRFYGGKGVFVCQRWRNSFDHFLTDMGDAPSPQHSLDRINTLGSYTCGKCEECQTNNYPLNCRWASKAEQARNQISNRYYTHDGKTLILKDWARLVGMSYSRLWYRLSVGMPFADAITLKGYDRKAITRAKQSGDCGLEIETKVRAIRARYAAGGVTQDELADEYGISQGTVSAILTGKRWAHIT